MFKELFELWSQKVVEAKSTQVKEFDRFKDRIVTLPGGDTSIELADAPDRKHHAASIESFADFVEDYENAVVWFNRAGAVAVLDDANDRRNTIRLDLTLSPQLVDLQTMERNQKPLTQKEVIQLLRIRFRDAGLGNLADLFRNVKFSVDTSGQQTLEKNKMSAGKSILAAFHGLDAIPDAIAFLVPMFASRFECRQEVMVAIEPDPQQQTFLLTPFPGEIERALCRAEMEFGVAVREAIKAETVPVLFGQP